MSKSEYRCFGPPGTGKTTWLSRQIGHAVEKRGDHRVLVCSFTRAAVAELNSRNLPIPPQNLGTLHAISYRALDHPKIIEDGKHLVEFSRQHPNYALVEGTRDSLDDGYQSSSGVAVGDKYMREYARLRALLRPRDKWPHHIMGFVRRWEKFKQENEGVDFTDLIELALNDVEYPPGLPEVGFFDEAQDFTPLEFALVRKWGSTMDRFILCGDDDQVLYSFKGAKPEYLLTPIDQDNVLTLKQSYRVPRAIHSYAERVIGRIPVGYRQQKEYLPKDVPGNIKKIPASFRQPGKIVETAMRFVDDKKSVLMLTTCGYMLSNLIGFMRDNGLPFSNPYRRRNRAWNPLFVNRDQMSSAERVRAFMNGFNKWDVSWTPSELEKWQPLVSGVFRRGWREITMPYAKDQEVTSEDLQKILKTPVLEIQDNYLEWFEKVLKKTVVNAATYALRVAQKHPEALDSKEEPLLRIGTVHSVKGGEADVVFLFPDLSPQAGREWRSPKPTGAHAIIRQFYVGITRAKETLYLCGPASRGMAIDWW